MSESADVIIIGGGMAGASLAAELASECDVVLLDAEDQPGRHATGRSAAMFFESYGNATVRALTRASRAWLENPPAGLAEAPLLSPRSALFVADADRVARLDAFLGSLDPSPSIRRVDAESARQLCPILRSDWVTGGIEDTSGRDLDVAAMHQGCLRLARRAGARAVMNAAASEIRRRDGTWQVQTPAGQFSAPVIVNAAGAWGDVVARLAGVPPVGLAALRRTCVLLPLPDGVQAGSWPMVIDVDETFYFKPESGQLLLSPANEDPMEPCDAMPEELDVAIAVDRFEQATSLEVRRLAHRWAGLRSFVADRSPVAGYDDAVEGFFWLVGQGGYGIQMAPALARAAAALLQRRELPRDILAQGATADALSPARDGLRAARASGR